MPKHQYFRSQVSKGVEKGAAGVDRNFEHDKGKGAIFGYGVVSKGPLQPRDIRDWEIDDVSLDQVVELGNASKSGIGIKSRFGHPNMSNEALGTFLGRAKNFRKDGDIVRADLYVDDTAYKTPNGDLATYVMDLAENDPAAFGSSMVFDAEFAVRLNEDGTRKKNEKTGKDLPELVRFKKLFASDIVDEPAANDGMFSGLFAGTNVELSAKGTEFLDKFLNNPDAVENVIKFLARYQKNRVDIDENKGPDGLKLKEETDMEPKDLTLEMLSKDRPDLVSAIKGPAELEAVKGERARALGIVKMANVEFKGMGMESLAEESIEKGNTLDAAASAMKGKRITDLNAKANPAPGADGEGTEKTHVEKAKEYQTEHPGCSITDALKATAEAKAKQ